MKKEVRSVFVFAVLFFCKTLSCADEQKQQNEIATKESQQQDNRVNDIDGYGKLRPVPQITLGMVYVWIKELLYNIVILPWWLDEAKARRARIYCNKCNAPLDSLQLNAYLAALAKTDKIAQLKKLWHQADIPEIEQFMCNVQNDLKMHCVPCLAFYGWHVQIPEIIEN